MTKSFSPRTREGEYNVRNFRATGNGSSNDTGPINAALQKCYDDGGGTVYIPAGNYRTEAPLIVRSNTTIVCDNNVRIFRTASGALLMNGDYDEDQAVYTGHGNIHVRGGVWDMRGNVVTNKNLGFAFAHAENVSFEGCTIKDVPGNHAIEVNSSKTVRIRNCRFLGYFDVDGGGTTNYNEAVQIDLALTGGGTFGAFGDYDDTPCTDVVVDSCYFGASGTASTTAWYRGVGSHSGKINFPHTDIRVTNNHFDGLLNYAVGMYGWENAVVAGNVFDTCWSGVLVTGATNQHTKNLTITNNIFREFTSTSVAAVTVAPVSTGFAYDVIVTNNSFTEIDDAGVQISRGDGVVVSDNIFRMIGKNAIYCTNTNDISVSDNHIKAASRSSSAGFHGIRMSTSVVGYRITGNRVRKHGSGNEVSKSIAIHSDCSGGYVRDNDTADIAIEDLGTSRAATEAFSVTHSMDASQTRSGASSATFDDLDAGGAGPTVTLQTNTKVLVIISGAISSGTAGVWGIMGVAVSGATTTAATDTNALAYRQSTLTNSINSTYQGSWVGELTVNPGSNTFTCKYRTASNSQSATFLRRKITVIPIN
ncbi:right-handed parallel beta-helix repeat-containing protein [Streptomyces griseus]|uniref:right-handed parallel beta-helix repeat-containing protein n=1 Tax=Streptomyces griseus TaxID=1911 RepID=UPI0033DF3164